VKVPLCDLGKLVSSHGAELVNSFIEVSVKIKFDLLLFFLQTHAIYNLITGMTQYEKSLCKLIFG
jgi:hypothetical protein